MRNVLTLLFPKSQMSSHSYRNHLLPPFGTHTGGGHCFLNTLHNELLGDPSGGQLVEERVDERHFSCIPPGLSSA